MAPAYALPTGLASAEFPAMGTSVTLALPERDAERGAELARMLFAQWEDALSRFRPESELSRLNARAGEYVEVSPLFAHVLETALRAARATDGIYDPTLCGQLVAVGYSASFELLPAEQPGTTVPLALWPGGGWRSIAYDSSSRRVMLPSGVGLDFGGIAKGMAVDATVERLREVGIPAALVNAGGDLAVLGLPPGATSGGDVDAWPIAVPGRETWATLPLARGALATSGVARRHWRQGGVARHHLLDPRTGAPAMTGLWSVTVAASRCSQAEVAAKATFILGPTEGARFLRARSLAGLLVYDDGRCESVGAWPPTVLPISLQPAERNSLALLEWQPGGESLHPLAPCQKRSGGEASHPLSRGEKGPGGAVQKEIGA